MPAGKRDVLVFDGGHADAVRGFGIRKYADGQSVYIVKYSVNRQTRRHSLGAVRRGNLKKMRDLAEEVKARGRLGQDIIGEEKARVAEKQAAQSAATVGVLVDIFQKERELMTRKVVERPACHPYTAGTARMRQPNAFSKSTSSRCTPSWSVP